MLHKGYVFPRKRNRSAVSSGQAGLCKQTSVLLAHVALPVNRISETTENFCLIKQEECRLLIITISVDAPSGQAIGIKEDLAVYLEQFGDARIVSIVEKEQEQTQLKGWR